MINLNKLKETIERMAAASKASVEVGFWDNGHIYPDGSDTPDVAFANEFGDPEKHQPPRPFMRQAIAADSNEWGRVVGELLPETDFDAKDVMDAVGYEMQSSIVKSIDTLVDPPLSKTTIAKKGHDKPLIDTGNMRNSVTYRVNGSE